MATPYFRQVPNFDYVTRGTDNKRISEYTQVKNLFRKGALRPDIADNLLFFTKYSIIGDERPDNVAFKFYEDESLDWVVLLSNNIINIQSEWPLPQKIFEEVMLEKYKTYDNFYNGTHHYETKEIRDSLGKIIIPSGIRISKTWQNGGGFIEVVGLGVYNYEYFDSGTSSIVTLSGNIIKPASGKELDSDLLTVVTNYDYETKLEDEKRNIFVLKSRYLNVVFNDIENIMTYKKGSEQFVSRTLKRGDNIRLYQ